MQKSKHCYFSKCNSSLNENLKITIQQILQLLHGYAMQYNFIMHNFLLYEKFQCPKFRYTEVIHKKLFLSFLEVHNCVWYLWTCPVPVHRSQSFDWPQGWKLIWIFNIYFFIFHLYLALVTKKMKIDIHCRNKKIKLYILDGFSLSKLKVRRYAETQIGLTQHLRWNSLQH